MQYKSPIMDFIKYKNGEKGTPGEKGDDGRTSYLHIKYSDDGKTFTDDNGETLGAWIGTYVDFTEADSTTFSDYKWKKFTEDVDGELEEIHQTIIEQSTQILEECDKMLFTALESYVETGSYASFKESVEAQLAILADNITMTFSKTQQAINSVDADLQEKFNQVTTYFTFDIDGLIIGKVDNPYKMVLTNERYSMTVNGDEVMYIDAVTKMAYFPKLTITEAFNVLGYQWEYGEEEGLVNIDWMGGA